MFALIFNAVTSSVAYSKNGLGQGSEIFCTSQGYEWITVETETSVSEQVQQHCELCLFPASENHLDDFILDRSANSIYACAQTSAHRNSSRQIIARFTFLIAQGRAPPSSTYSI